MPSISAPRWVGDTLKTYYNWNLTLCNDLSVGIGNYTLGLDLVTEIVHHPTTVADVATKGGQVRQGARSPVHRVQDGNKLGRCLCR